MTTLSGKATSISKRVRITLLLWPLLALANIEAQTAGHASDASPSQPSVLQAQSDTQSDIGLPVNFERYTGDLDAMVKRSSIRALVLYSRSGFFYVDGRPQGIYYEALQAFEQFVNQRVRSKQHIQVTFIPVRLDHLEAALEQGLGDVIAYGLVVTPERERQVDFSTPVQTNLKEIVVTGKNFGPVSSTADLSGKKVFVNPLTAYYQNLQKMSQSLVAEGKPPILIETADKSLLDEDLLEMVNAGILPATVTTTDRAQLWASVYPNITPQPQLVVADEGDLAFAMRKNSPQLKALLDDFAKTHAIGTSFGNTLRRQYLQSDQYLRNPTSQAEIKKFTETADFFKKYSSEYSFDYLMVVAQGYQESRLEQSARGGGAVGIMQVEPRTAAAPPISIPDVLTAENNIHAGVKILHADLGPIFQRPRYRSREPLALYVRCVQRRPESHRRASQKGASSGPRS